MADKRKIGRYEIQSRIGSGAMGSVFKAIDPVIKRVVAIKKVRLDLVTDPEVKENYRRRFFTEAEIGGKLLHPNIVVLHDVGEENGVPFIAMEYVEGKT